MYNINIKKIDGFNFMKIRWVTKTLNIVKTTVTFQIWSYDGIPAMCS